MSPSLYFKDQHKKYLLVVRKDLYRGIVNPYFLELQQKYVVGEENCPYELRCSYELHMGSFPHPRHIFAAAQENKDLRSPFRGPSLILTNISCADP